jgi:hypothetical protein
MLRWAPMRREANLTALKRHFRLPRLLMVAAILGVAALAVSAAPALANTSNADSTNVVAVQNGDGTVTVTVSGTWTWPSGQQCVGRYGTGWVVSWWGIGSSHPLPSNNFALLSMSAITSSDQGINGTTVATLTNVTATDSLQFPSGLPYAGQYFYLPPVYNGSEIFTQAFCNAAQPPSGTSTDPFNGTYTATATYPNANDVPPVLCVNTYDEHGKLDSPTTKPGDTLGNDYLPNKDGDNSIQQKQFVDTTLQCDTVTTTIVPTGGSIGGLGLAGLIAFFAVLLVGGQAVFRRRRGANPAQG